MPEPPLPPSRDSALGQVLHRTHLNHPEQLPVLVADAAALLGARECVMYLVDYEQVTLVPLGPDLAGRRALSVDGSIAGRAFRHVEVVEAGGSGDRRLWVPLLDGIERLGVMELVLPAGEEVGDAEREAFAHLAHLAAELTVTNGAYTDTFEWTRRLQPMNLAAEMLHHLLPPLTFATDRLIVSGLLAPAYEVGGDAYDYALNGNIAHIAVFDAVGHGLVASQLAALAVSCYRNSRRAGLDLAHTALAIDAVVAELFGAERFVTAVLAQLDVESGVVRYLNAGHPEPMLLRDGQLVKELSSEPLLPLGLNALVGAARAEDVVVRDESLQPGDRLLLVTDGVDEARTESGEFFGRSRLAEFAARESASGLPTPEVMRRLQQAILRYQVGKLQDDATTLFVEWRTGQEREQVPRDH